MTPCSFPPPRQEKTLGVEEGRSTLVMGGSNHHYFTGLGPKNHGQDFLSIALGKICVYLLLLHSSSKNPPIP